MATYFIFTRKQRSSAVLLIFNAFVAILLYLAAHKYLPGITSDQHALTQLLDVLDIVIWVLEIVLLGLALWFWRENKEIKISVTPRHLSVFDPTFGDVAWQVNIRDITELKQVSYAGQKSTSNLIVLKNAETKQLMYSNYRRFDRRAFFNALILANPNIILPDNIYTYKIQRPSWAKLIRKKLGLKE
jgi:hypothetical protein